MKSRLVCLLLVLFSTGCYTTHIRNSDTSSLSPVSAQEFESRQWFMFGGLLPVSDVGGNPCADGFAEVESGISGRDIAYSAGIFLLETALVGFMAWSEADPAVYGTVGSLALILTPSSRTTTYRCSGRLSSPPVVPSTQEDEEVDYGWDDYDGSFR